MPAAARSLARWCRLVGSAAAVVSSAAVAAAMPSFEAFDAALQRMQPAARALGLSLQMGPLWAAPLRARSPVLALHHAGRCLVAYAPSLPGADFGWLFPPLPERDRELWLEGVVHHELAHCWWQREAGSAPSRAAALTGTPASTRAGPAAEEVFGDLAFAAHVLTQPGGDALVRLLARLRRERGITDPAHDSAAALRCAIERTAAAPAPAGVGTPPFGDRWPLWQSCARADSSRDGADSPD